MQGLLEFRWIGGPMVLQNKAQALWFLCSERTCLWRGNNRRPEYSKFVSKADCGVASTSCNHVCKRLAKCASQAQDTFRQRMSPKPPSIYWDSHALNPAVHTCTEYDDKFSARIARSMKHFFNFVIHIRVMCYIRMDGECLRRQYMRSMPKYVMLAAAAQDMQAI